MTPKNDWLKIDQFKCVPRSVSPKEISRDTLGGSKKTTEARLCPWDTGHGWDTLGHGGTRLVDFGHDKAISSTPADTSTTPADTSSVQSGHAAKASQPSKCANRQSAQTTKQQQIADAVGVHRNTVSSDLNQCTEKTVMTEKTVQPTKKTVYQINQYTKPETAAEKIRAKFGDDFALQLAASIQTEITP